MSKENKENNALWELSLDSDAFLLMKTNFNRMLTNMLKLMQSNEAEVGTIAVKLDVKLESATVPVDVEGKETRTSTKPVFEYKISVNVQKKGENKGECGGDGFELVYDPKTEKYVLKGVEDPQTDLFDGEEAEEGEEVIPMPDNSREVRLLAETFKRAHGERKKPILLGIQCEEAVND